MPFDRTAEFRHKVNVYYIMQRKSWKYKWQFEGRADVAEYCKRKLGQNMIITTHVKWVLCRLS